MPQYKKSLQKKSTKESAHQDGTAFQEAGCLLLQFESRTNPVLQTFVCGCVNLTKLTTILSSLEVPSVCRVSLGNVDGDKVCHLGEVLA